MVYWAIDCLPSCFLYTHVKENLKTFKQSDIENMQCMYSGVNKGLYVVARNFFLLLLLFCLALPGSCLAKQTNL